MFKETMRASTSASREGDWLGASQRRRAEAHRREAAEHGARRQPSSASRAARRADGLYAHVPRGVLDAYYVEVDAKTLLPVDGSFAASATARRGEAEQRVAQKEAERKALESTKKPSDYYNVELHRRVNPLAIPALWKTGESTMRAGFTKEEHVILGKDEKGNDLDALMWRAHRRRTETATYVEAMAREERQTRAQHEWEERQLGKPMPKRPKSARR